MKTHNTQAKKLEFLLSIGSIKKESLKDRPPYIDPRKTELNFTYSFRLFNPSEDDSFERITQDVKSVKDFINTIYYILTKNS